MDRTKNRINLLLVLVAGCFAVGFFELYCFTNTVTTADFLLCESKDYVISLVAMFFLLGLTILVFQQNCCLYSLIWVMSYFVGARFVWNMNDKKIFMILSHFMALLLLAVVILDIANIKNQVTIKLSKFIWFFVMVAQFSIIYYQIFYREIGPAVFLFYGAWFYIVLFSMTQTISSLKIFSVPGTILGISSPILMIMHSFYQSNLVIEEPFTKLLYHLPSIAIAIIMLLYVIWIKKPVPDQRKYILLRGALAISIGVLISLIYVYHYIRAYNNDIGVRKLSAKTAYIDQLEQDEYNWMEIAGIEEMVSTTQLKHCIVDLNDGSMPVMLLSRGSSNTANGDTRIVFYNEEKQEPYQVWGKHKYISVVGYIPSDKEHEYPLIYCRGGRQGVDYESIYEVRNNNLYLVAEMYDVWPLELDETDPEIYQKNDEYYWMGEKVSMVQYWNNRDAISKGYVDIPWNS